MSKQSLVQSLAILVLSAGGISAQELPSIWLAVESNLPTSLVLVDSAYVGRANGDWHRIPGQSRTVLLVPTEVGAWDLPQPHAELSAEAGDTVAIRLDFPYLYRIDSVPFGATVLLPEQDNQALGQTPLVVTREQPLTGVLLLRKEGYASAELTAGRDVVNRHSVIMRPVDLQAAGNEAVDWDPPGSSQAWINWVAAGVAITGGALAVHFKFTADDYYDEYLETGDPSIRDEVKRFDTYSYVALGAMQLGVGVLVFRLAF